MMIELLAEMVRSDNELKEFFIKEMSRAIGRPEREMIPLKAAAAKIGKSASWLYKNKESFSYEKTGNSKSSTVMFDSSKLFEEYDMLVASRKKIVRMQPLNVAVC